MCYFDMAYDDYEAVQVLLKERKTVLIKKLS